MTEKKRRSYACSICVLKGSPSAEHKKCRASGILADRIAVLQSGAQEVLDACTTGDRNQPEAVSYYGVSFLEAINR